MGLRGVVCIGRVDVDVVFGVGIFFPVLVVCVACVLVFLVVFGGCGGCVCFGGFGCL